MRFLVIARRRNYFNPTRQLLLDALATHESFAVVGPGYGPVCNRLKEYFIKFGRFDGVVVDAAIYLTTQTDKLRLYWPGADAQTLVDLFDYSHRIVVLNLLDDFHGTTPAQLR